MGRKILIIIAIIGVNIYGWYMGINNAVTVSDDKNQLVEIAQEYRDENLCVKAVKAYQDVLKEKDTLEIRYEMMDVYKRGMENGEYKNGNEYEAFLEQTLELYNKEPEPYEILASYYIEQEKYDDCIMIIKKAINREITSEILSDILHSIRYKYSISHNIYESYSELSGGYYTVKSGEKYGYIDKDGKMFTDITYDIATPFSLDMETNVSLVKEKSYLYIMDQNLVRQAYLEGDFPEFSGFGNSLSACTDGKKYQYYSLDGKAAFGEYDYAGRFRNSIAAVRDGKNWRLINVQGDYVNDTIYADIKLNSLEECAAKGILFLKEKEKYQMYNTSLEGISDFSCDDADLFVTNESCAYKDEKQWGFVSMEGEIKIKPKFDEAKSFSNGLAGVKKNGKWGFIDETGEIVIEPIFIDVGYFNDRGSCFVETEDGWSIITLYYVD